MFLSGKLANFAHKSQYVVIFDFVMDYKKIGETIRERRKALNVNQPTLALLAGVGVNTLVAIERGNGNPKLSSLLAVLDTLGLQFKIALKD